MYCFPQNMYNLEKNSFVPSDCLRIMIMFDTDKCSDPFQYLRK